MTQLEQNATGLDMLERTERSLFANTYEYKKPYGEDSAPFWDAVNIIRQAQLRVRTSIFKQVNGWDLARFLKAGLPHE